MAVVIPKFSDIYSSILSDLQNKLGINSLVGKTVLPAIAAVYAAKQVIQYTTTYTVNKNIYPDTCDEDTLRRFGRVRLGRDISPAIAGEYTVNVTGENGGVIPISTTFTNEKGYIYVIDTQVTLSGTTGTASIRSLTTGIEAILTVGDILQLTSPLANIDSFCDVDSVDVQPTIEETVEEYRVNVVNSFRLTPQGGSRSDYRTWTESVSGVREVYPYQVGYGEVDLFVEAFPDDSTDDHGTPSGTILTAVENAIEPDKLPIGVYTVNYTAVTPISVDVEITNLSDIDKLTTIESLIIDYLYNIRPYIAGADLISEINKGKLYASSIIQIIIDLGLSFDSVELQVDGNVVTSYTFTNGDIPFLDTLTNV